MIIISDNEVPDAKTIGIQASEAEPLDPPPIYIASSDPLVTSTPSVPSPSLLKSRSINYISLDRADNAIKGHFIIDPSMVIPRSLLPPLAGEAEEDRKNLRMNTANGSIDVDVTLIGGTKSLGFDDVRRNRRTTLDINSDNGPVNVRLRTSGTPIPFHLNTTSRNGSITIRLPRTFTGLVTIYAKNGCVTFSDEVSGHMTMCNEDKHTQRRFVGDLSAFNDDDGDWKGDELNVEAQNGNVKVYFVDEVAHEIFKGKGCVIS
jgi:hypothetical protein